MSFHVNQDIWACGETFLSYKNDAEKSLKKENYTEKEASQHNGGSLVAWRTHGLRDLQASLQCCAYGSTV